MSSKGKLAAGYMELGFLCDKCRKPRSTGNHKECSKARQREHARRNDHDSQTVA